MAAGTQPMYSNMGDLSNIATMLIPSEFLIDNPTYLYSDINMTITKQNGYYSDGTYWYHVTGGLGRITDAGNCG
jgi:hypothetical protein